MIGINAMKHKCRTRQCDNCHRNPNSLDKKQTHIFNAINLDCQRDSIFEIKNERYY
jgi:hypothetical protein